MTAHPEQLLRHIRRLASRPAAEPDSDAELLRRFVRCRDEDAFAALVARHGGMVLGVCRRVLRDGHAAEDAAQATFLVLARKAAAIRRPARLAAWLHGTARRLAQACLRAEARRQRREARSLLASPPGPPRSPLDELSAGELLAVVDEEVGRLPEAYRLPVVLCCLEGLSQEETATRLGWTAGSVKGRLERGRARLHSRLARRGIPLAGAFAAVEVARGGAAGMPALLAEATVQAALAFAAGHGAVGAGIPSRVAALTGIGLEGLAGSRVKWALVLLAALALGGTGVLAHQILARQQADAAQQDPLPASANDNGKPRPDGPTAVRADCYGDPLPPGAVARLGTVRFRHGQWVRSLAFSPDGKRIASASADHTIRLWDRDSGREVRRLTGHRDSVNFVAFTAEGKQLISASGYFMPGIAAVKDASVRLWDVKTGLEVRRFPQTSTGQPWAPLALSPDGKLLAAGSENSIELFEVPSSRRRGGCSLPMGHVKSVRFSPDGKRLAAAVESVGVCLFDVGTGQLVWQNADQTTDSYYQAVAFAPDGRTVAAATSVKQPMHLLDAATGKEVRRFEDGHDAAPPLIFSRDGKRLFSNGSGQRGIIWDVATGKPAGALDSPFDTAIFLALSPDANVLAVGGNRTIRLWDTSTGKGIPEPDGAQALISSLAVSPDGKAILTASHFDAEAGARVWDMAPARQRAALAGHQCPVAAFAPDGKTFVAGCFQGTPVLADAATGKKVRAFEGTPNWVDSLAFTPDGKRVIGTTMVDRSIRVWDPSTGKELPALGRLPVGSCKCLAVAPDGRLLATGGMDKVIRLWDIAARKEVGQLTGQEGSIWALAFSPDSREIAAVTAKGEFNFFADGTDRAIRVWEIATGRIVRALEGPADGSWSVAWSPDGRVLATGGEDGVIRLWERMTWQERARLTGHEGPVSALAFTPDGTRLISGSSDTTALVWDLAALGRPARPPGADELPALWADLGGDAARACRAVVALVTVPDLAVPLLTQKVRPVTPPEPERLARLVADLDSDDFGVRQRATRDLEGMGELAEPALKAALAKGPSAELRRRAERLLERLAEPPPDQWAALRAVEVLERIGTPEARRLLKELASAAPGARLTREARASLERLARRPAP